MLHTNFCWEGNGDNLSLVRFDTQVQTRVVGWETAHTITELFVTCSICEDYDLASPLGRGATV